MHSSANHILHHSGKVRLLLCLVELREQYISTTREKEPPKQNHGQIELIAGNSETARGRKPEIEVEQKTNKSVVDQGLEEDANKVRLLASD